MVRAGCRLCVISSNSTVDSHVLLWAWQAERIERLQAASGGPDTQWVRWLARNASWV